MGGGAHQHRTGRCFREGGGLTSGCLRIAPAALLPWLPLATKRTPNMDMAWTCAREMSVMVHRMHHRVHGGVLEKPLPRRAQLSASAMHLLCSLVVGIVEPGRESVRAHEDPPLHLDGQPQQHRCTEGGVMHGQETTP